MHIYPYLHHYVHASVFHPNCTAGWFERFPEPPLGILARVDALLGFHDGILVRLYMRHAYTKQPPSPPTSYVHSITNYRICHSILTGPLLWAVVHPGGCS